MYTVSETTHVNAPLDRCFLLGTSIKLVSRTLKMHALERDENELIQPNDRLIWHGWKFGLPQMHETRVTAYDRPHYFQDSMGRGRFKRYQHEHTFTEIDGHTLLHDKIRFSLPLGWVGDMVAKTLIVPYIAGMLHRHLQLLKRVAETEEWRKYLPADPSGPAVAAGHDASGDTSAISSQQ
jgi:ligand-binding SRPBCC domain-containing protein